MKEDLAIGKNKCFMCGKKKSHGNSLTYRGLPKKTGGIGLKITGKGKRTFEPNLQTVKHEEEGLILKVRVCTKCIKAGKVKKPTVAKVAAE